MIKRLSLLLLTSLNLVMATPAVSTTPMAATTPTTTANNTQPLKLLRSHYNPRTQQTVAVYQQRLHGVPVQGHLLTVRTPGKIQHPATMPSLSSLPNTARISGKRLDNATDLDASTLAFYQAKAQRDASLQAAMRPFETADFSMRTQAVGAALFISQVQGELIPVYRLQFYVKPRQAPQRLMTLVVDARNPEIILAAYDALQGSKMQDDILAGGNTKTGLYHYGLDDVPALTVKRRGEQCMLQNKKITVVNAFERPFKEDYKKPLRYRCGDAEHDTLCTCVNNPWWLGLLKGYELATTTVYTTPEAITTFINSQTDPTVRQLFQLWYHTQQTVADLTENQDEYCYCAYSPANDAYFFGQTVHNLFNDWYQTNVSKRRMILRVHVVDADAYREHNNTDFAGAYWDPAKKMMNFGDGERANAHSYPYVTLAVAAHELAHGFTQAHANLTYVEQTGSLNESFSDMAAIAAMDYLRQTQPTLHQKIYGSDTLHWKVGHVINTSPWDHQNAHQPEKYELRSLRYLDQPSNDNASADCFNDVEGCLINFATLRELAWYHGQFQAMVTCSEELQAYCTSLFFNNYLVHTASGIFNKAFYHLATQEDWSVRLAFEVMLTANRDGYWQDRGELNQDGFFEEAACGVVQASHDLGYGTEAVIHAFQQVGLLLDDHPCHWD